MGMTEDDKRNCCLVEIQETEAKYYKTLEDIEKVSVCAECAVHLRWSVLIKVRFLSGHKLSHCHFFFVGVSGLWAGSQHGNVSYWQIHWRAQMSQQLIDSVINGSASTGDTEPWGFKYWPYTSQAQGHTQTHAYWQQVFGKLP